MNNIKKLFPILNNNVSCSNNITKQLHYLDSASTTQKPIMVINKIKEYYENYNSNIHRSVYKLAEIATEKYEQTRHTVAKFINCKPNEIVFTKGATESINLLASSLKNIKNNTVILSELEHHSNIVPWQLNNYNIKTIKLLNGELEINEEIFKENENSILSITHVSNSLGIINDIKQICELAKKYNILTIIDGCQSVQHMKINVEDLNCDFYVFSAHKIYSTTGVGILYGKYDLLNNLPPYQGGGEMISNVSFDITSYNEVPYKFEAGTPNIEGVIILNTALEWFNSIPKSIIKKNDNDLMIKLTNELKNFKKINMIFPDIQRVGILSISHSDIHVHDIAQYLSDKGICVRSGNHCNQPLMNKLNINGTCRISLGIYNDVVDIDILIKELYNMEKYFG